MTHQKEARIQPHEASSLSTTWLSSTPHKHPLSPEWIHANTILLGHPLTSEVGQHIQKWIISQANLSFTKFALRWDPIQFEDNKLLQKYEETDGSISYLKSNVVKQLVSLRICMTLLISQNRPADQKNDLFHFILGEQLFKLTAIDMKTALINEMLENPRSKTTPRTPKSKFTSPSSSLEPEKMYLCLCLQSEWFVQGLCWIAQLSSPITAPLSLEQQQG